LGRGKGCYDRFLARTHMSAAYRIGVGFSLQMQPDVPTDSYDIVMNAVCTEEDTFESTAVDAD
jgi:5-formyltetrahydrofolate cyclo-ligase